MTEAMQNKHNQQYAPRKNDISDVFSTKLIVSHASCFVGATPTFMSWERFGLSCHVLSGHNLLQSVHSAVCFLEV